MVAGQLAIAIDNARLRSRAEGERRTLQAVINQMPEGVVIADAPDGRISMVNSAAVQLTGQLLIEFLRSPGPDGPKCWNLYRPDGSKPLSPQDLPLNRAISKGEICNGEKGLMRRPDGKEIILLLNCAPLINDSGVITGAEIFQDITPQERHQQELS